MSIGSRPAESLKWMGRVSDHGGASARGEARATVNREGVFRIDDVPVGKYVLDVWFSQHSAGHLSRYRFSVPEGGKADANLSIDLGVLTLERP